MKNLFQITLGMSIALIGVSASAATYYKNEGQCQAMYAAGETAPYAPSARHVAYDNNARIAGMEVVGLETDACAYMATAAGNQWVFLPQGTKVYVKGAQVFFLAECRNTIIKIVSLKARTVAERALNAEPAQQVAAAPASWNIPKAGFIEIPSWVPKTLENGKIYIAPNGDTYQDVRFTRLCINLMEGEIIDWRGTFASSPEEALKQCLAWQAGETYKHTLPDTSNQSPSAAPAPQVAPQPQSAAPQAPIAQAPQAAAPQQPAPQAAAPQPQGSKGSHTCNAKLANGQFVDATGVDLSDCHKNLHAKVLAIDPNARQQGDIVRGHRPQS